MGKSIYEPYASLDDLLAGAGVRAEEMWKFTTTELLAMAEAGRVTRVAPPPRGLPDEEAPFAIRSCRMALSTEAALLRIAHEKAISPSAAMVTAVREWLAREGA